MKRITLLMTACIDPSNGPICIATSDPLQRLAQYSVALDYWLKYEDARITGLVFVENSGYRLGDLERCAHASNQFGRDVEFIQTNDNWYPPEVDYGYSELRMVDASCNRSEVLRKSDAFVKVTGRLVFPTLGRLLNTLPDEILFAVDCHSTGVFRKSIYVTTQLMIFSCAFYTEHLMGSYAKMDLSLRNIESLLLAELIKFRGVPGAILRWPQNCDPVGNAARSGHSYNSVQKRLIALLRAGSRRVTPRWWL